MVDLGKGAVGGVIAQLDAIPMTIDDRRQWQGHRPSVAGREREMENMARCRVGDGVRTGGVTGQRQPRTLHR